jgi:hypothetical protein
MALLMVHVTDHRYSRMRNRRRHIRLVGSVLMRRNLQETRRLGRVQQVALTVAMLCL